MTPAAGTVIAERFRLVRPLGEGGMGSVWLAEHLGLDVLCAVKLIQADAQGSADVRRRFEREAKIAAQIRSPHVVHILDHGVWEETPYIVMEYLEGEDLEQRLSRVGRLSAVETATIIAQVARALNRAHTAGLVHRDLKPANIFLARDDDREIVKVLDFGIAKDITPKVASTTRTGSLLGTPAYMSPEQAQGVRAVDHRSDLWSLAVVIFECLTGKLPFESDAFGDLLLKIMVQELPVPSQLAPVPPGFDAWWVRAASRDPAQRFQSARELAESLLFALGISTGSGVELRSSISDMFMVASIIPGMPSDRASSPLMERASTPPLERASSPIVEATTAVAGAPALGSAATVVAASGAAEPGYAAAHAAHDGPSSAPSTLPSEERTGSGIVALARPRHPTAGPVSTSLQPRSEPAKGVRRVILGALVGVAVASGAAFLLLRGGAPPVEIEPMAQDGRSAAAGGESPGGQAIEVSPAPPEPTPPVPSPVVSASAAPPDAPLPGSAAATEARPADQPSAEPAVTAPPTSRPAAPRPSFTGKKKRDPRDFGI